MKQQTETERAQTLMRVIHHAIEPYNEDTFIATTALYELLRGIYGQSRLDPTKSFSEHLRTMADYYAMLESADVATEGAGMVAGGDA